MNDSSSDHLAWLALQYVCDELGDEERAAFEQRLAEDQAAREAVAEAVEQCAAMRVVFRAWVEGAPRVIATPFPMPHASAAEAAARAAELAPKPSKWRRAAVAAAWMTAGAAASLLALAVLPGQSGDEVATTAALVDAGGATPADDDEVDYLDVAADHGALAADQQPWEMLRVEPLVPRPDDWMLALVVSGMQPAEGATGEGETKN